MHFHLFRYVEHSVIKANRQRLSSKVKVEGWVKVKGGQGQSLTLTLNCVLENSWTCDHEMNLVMDREFDLEITLTLG